MHYLLLYDVRTYIKEIIKKVLFYYIIIFVAVCLNKYLSNTFDYSFIYMILGINVNLDALSWINISLYLFPCMLYLYIFYVFIFYNAKKTIDNVHFRMNQMFYFAIKLFNTLIFTIITICLTYLLVSLFANLKIDFIIIYKNIIYILLMQNIFCFIIFMYCLKKILIIPLLIIFIIVFTLNINIINFNINSIFILPLIILSNIIIYNSKYVKIMENL